MLENDGFNPFQVIKGEYIQKDILSVMLLTLIDAGAHSSYPIGESRFSPQRNIVCTWEQSV